MFLFFYELCKMTKKMLTMAVLGSATLLLAGCNNTPVEPVEVPEDVTIVEEGILSEEEVVVDEMPVEEVLSGEEEVLPEEVLSEEVVVEVNDPVLDASDTEVLVEPEAPVAE